MYKTIKSRLAHARRKVDEGKKVNKYEGMIRNYEDMLKTEHRENKNFVYQKYPKGAKENGIKGGYKLV